MQLLRLTHASFDNARFALSRYHCHCLLSGMKKTVDSDCRGMVGVVAGGERTEKPVMKAGRAYHKYRTNLFYVIF
jgi:ribosomal protein L2